MLLRHAVGLLLAASLGLLLAVASLAGTPKGGGGTGPPTWVPGPPPCHGHSSCSPSTVTDVVTTTVAETTTLAGTSSVVSDPPASPSDASGDADVSVRVTAPAGNVFTGTRQTFAVTIANDGPDPATSVHLDVIPAGSRMLSSAAGDLGELASGASATVKVTLVPDGPGMLAATFTAAADQVDPRLANNVAVVSMPVLAGHAGPPGLTTPGQGAFRPPLLAVRAHGGWRVATRVFVDEPASVTVRVVDGSGKPQTMLPGTLVDYLPANRPHTSIPHDLHGPAWVPLDIRIGGPAGRRYRVVVSATGPDGSAASTSIGFRTP